MTFRILFISLFCCLTVIRLVYRIRYRVFFKRYQIRIEGWGVVLFRLVLGAGLLYAVAMYLFFPGIGELLYVPVPLQARAAGFCIGLLCLVGLWWVHHTLGSSFSTSIDVNLRNRLITTGPYRFIRHPMYVAYLLFFAAVFLVSEGWLTGAAGGLIIGSLMTIRLKKEEAVLLKRFGEEYAEYAARTPRFFIHVLPKKAVNNKSDFPGAVE